MEFEIDDLPTEKPTEGHHKVANLPKQTVLLNAQTYNSLLYQRHMNVLSMLISNSTKVKEVLKEQSLKLDGIENEYLFGEKCKEKLSKVTTAKIKSKTIFTGLQKSLTFPPNHQHLLNRLSVPKQPTKRACRFVVPKSSF